VHWPPPPPPPNNHPPVSTGPIYLNRREDTIREEAQKRGLAPKYSISISSNAIKKREQRASSECIRVVMDMCKSCRKAKEIGKKDKQER